jgi:hypothetical protein
MSLEQKIIDYLKDHTVLEAVDEFASKNYRDVEVINAFVNLHNSSTIDLFKEFLNLKNDKGFSFFSSRHLLEDALPNLEIDDIGKMLVTLDKLIQEAGNDMAAGTPVSSFGKRLETNFEFAKNVLNHLKSHDYSTNFLTKTLLSISFADLEFAINQSEEIIQENLSTKVGYAILALGQMNYKDNHQLLTHVIKLICSYQKQDIDLHTQALIIKSLLEIAKNKLDSYEEIKQKITSIITSNSYDAGSIHVCITQLFYDHETLPEEIKNLLLEMIPYISSSSTGTINYLDMVIPKIYPESETKIKELLESLFMRSDFQIDISQFPSLKSYLYDNSEKLSSLITRWFLSKSIQLNKFATDLIDNNEIELAFDMTQLSEASSTAHLFLARKACGWYFMNPSVAISLIYSVYKTCPIEQAKDIQDIIFNPLMISYPRKVTEFLNKHKEGLEQDKLEIIENLLKKLENYHDALRASNNIKELRVGQTEDFAYRRHQQQMMNKAYAESRKNSLFGSLFTENTLLYGKNTAFIIQTGEGSQRQTMPLHSFSHSIDFPSMEILDSTSLHHTLLTFKLEGIRK